MKHTFKTLLGLLLVVLVLVGCSNPAGPEIPEGAKVEFILGTNPQVSTTFDSKTFYFKFSKYLLCLNSDQNENNSYKYPKGYEDIYMDFNGANEDYLKKLCEDTFEEAFGTKYYKEGTTIDLKNDLKKWTSPARDLTTPDNYPGFSQLYFLAEDIGTNYDNLESLETIEVHNESIKVYVYWNYYRN